MVIDKKSYKPAT